MKLKFDMFFKTIYDGRNEISINKMKYAKRINVPNTGVYTRGGGYFFRVWFKLYESIPEVSILCTV